MNHFLQQATGISKSKCVNKEAV